MEARLSGEAELFAGTISIATANYKCERAISLPDCFILSLGKNKSLKALFAARERELAEEMMRRPFDVEIRFLENHESNRPERRP